MMELVLIVYTREGGEGRAEGGDNALIHFTSIHFTL